MKKFIENEIKYYNVEIKAILFDCNKYTGTRFYFFMYKKLRKLIKLSKRIDELERVLKNIERSGYYSA